MAYRCSYLCFFYFWLGAVVLQAQLLYTDFQPRYRSLQGVYRLDKIEYHRGQTIIFFRFACDNLRYTGATFFAPPSAQAWFLREVGGQGRVFELLDVRRIEVDNRLVVGHLASPQFRVNTGRREGYSFISCELHFPALPPDVQWVDLLEGEGLAPEKFDCLEIEIKGPQELSLGNLAVYERSLRLFEQGFGLVGGGSNSKFACETKQILRHLEFQDNSLVFVSKPQAEAELETLLAYLEAVPKARLRIRGHTDIFGSAKRNLELSKARAEGIARYLAGRGLSMKRMEVLGLGAGEPLYPEGDARNRRVEVEIFCID